MAATVMIGVSFIIALIVSTIIIFVVTKLFGETEGIITALIAALAGTVIVYYRLLAAGDGIHCRVPRGNRLAGGPPDPVQDRLGEGPGHCRDRMACHWFRRLVPAHPRRAGLMRDRQPMKELTLSDIK